MKGIDENVDHERPLAASAGVRLHKKGSQVAWEKGE